MNHTHASLKQISFPTAVFGGGLLLAAPMVFAAKEDVAPFVIFLLGISLALVIAILVEPQDLKILFSLFFLAFLIRCFLSLLFFLLSYTQIGSDQLSWAPGFLLRSDGCCYSQKAWEMAKYYLMDIPLTSEALYRIKMHSAGTITNYDFWGAKVYYHIGKSPLSMFFILSFLSSLTPLFVYSLAKGIFSKKVAFWSAFLSGFWPSLIFWPTQNLKEPLLCFGIVLFFYSFVNLIKKFKPLFFLSIVISTFILWRISSWMLLPMIFVIGVSLFMNFTGMSVISLIWGIILIIPSLLLFHDEILHFLVNVSPAMSSKFGPFLEYSLSLDAINYLRSVRAYGNLAILPNFDISSPTNMLLFLPIGLIYAWFAPFPWNVGSISQIIGIPEMILFYFLFPKLVRGIAFSWREREKETSAIIFFIIVMSLILALIEGNAGTLFRHRSFILYFCFIFISVGIFRKELVASEKGKV